jgi:hypothetical protein
VVIRAGRLFLLVAILSSFLILPGRARGQGVQCSTYLFPSGAGGWTVLTGTSGSDYVQSVQSAIPGPLNTFPRGSDTGAVIDAFLTLPNDFYLYSVGFTVYTTVSNQWTKGVVEALQGSSFDGYAVISSKSIIQAEYFSWSQYTTYFESPITNAIEIFVGNAANPVVVTVGSMSICGGPAVTLTPTPSDTMTPTNTPIYTPTFTFTPSPTPTLTPSDTPTAGPSPTASDTPVFSSTPASTPTVAASSTAIGIHTGGKLFATVPPPQQCSDVFNPCGELPYAVPGFPTIVLPSPTPPAVTSIGPTGTFIGTSTPYGTTTGTPISPTATITGTFNAGQDQIAAFATNGVNTVNGIAATPGLFDPSGPLATLPDTANQVGSYVGDFFGIVRAVQGFFLGKTGTIIAFLLLILLYILIVRLILFALPIIMKVFDLLLQIIQAIIP